MNDNEIYDLLDRIAAEPSVLLFGQDYLALEGDDFVIKTIGEKLNIRLKSFADLYDVVRDKMITEEVAKKAINEAVQNCPSPVWLKTILNMRWSIIYTSALDKCIADALELHMYTSIDENYKKYKWEYINKHEKHLVPLFGSACGEYTLDSVKKKRSYGMQTERFRWIYNNIIPYEGVLIVDGWKPNDRLKLDDVIIEIGEVYPQHIYIFGITEEELKKNADEDTKQIIDEYIKEKYITLNESSFKKALDDIGYFDKNDENEDEEYHDESYYVTVKINKKIGDEIFRFNIEDINHLNIDCTIMHDSLIPPRSHITEMERTDKFIDFLCQSNFIPWELYSENYKFYSKRIYDDEIFGKVNEQLRRSSYERRPVVLCGPSNSGKTSMLVNFAIKARHIGLSKPSIIFFISGASIGGTEDWINGLEKICKECIVEKQNKYGPSVNVIVIWDNPVDSNAYNHLQKELQEYNVLVVGSSYRANLVCNNIDVKADLETSDSFNEFTEFMNTIGQIDDGLRDYLQQKYNNEKNIFSILSKIGRYNQSLLQSQMSEIFCSRLRREADYIEIETFKSKQFFDDMERHSEIFDELGIAPELREGLDNEKENDIKWLNEMLAVSGQFGIGLPLSLIMRFLYGKDDYIDRVKFIKEVLNINTLIVHNTDSTGKSYVSFRHPAEASAYLKLMWHDIGDRTQNEVKLLKDIIYYCDWDMDTGNEGNIVIKLIRKFGPNSDGKPHDAFKSQKGRYEEYKSYWIDIAEAIKECGAIQNKEALLVMCHFIRESVRKITNNGKPIEENANWLKKAQKELREVLEHHDTENVAQLSRIGGELCANYNVCMHDEWDDFDNSFAGFEKDFRTTYNFFVDASRYKHNYTTSPNMLLDIWLNAVDNYKNKKYKDSENEKIADKYKELICKSEYYTERLLDIDNTASDGQPEVSSLMGKISDVFKDAKKLLDSITDINQYKSMLERNNNDSYIYMLAFRTLIENASEDKFEYPEDEFYMNRAKGILWFLNENGARYMTVEDMQRIKQHLKPAAEKVALLFEETANRNLIRNSKSIRCQYLYLKVKWFLMTGNLLMEEKQHPRITKEQWTEIGKIAEDYLRFSERTMDISPAAKYIYAVYKWIYTEDVAEANECFKDLKYRINSLQRIGICNENGILKKFTIAINVNNSIPYARIIGVDCGNASENLVGRRNIKVSSRLQGILYKGEKPKNCKKQDVVIWFNNMGPVADITRERE